jgi:pseudouridine synthase
LLHRARATLSFLVLPRMAASPSRRPTASRKELARLLLRYGVASRAAAAECVRAGRVRVGGRVVRDPQAWVEADAAIEIDARAARPPERVVVMLHKPTGCVTTTRDPQGRPTVYEHVAGVPTALREGLRAIGRLDLDTSGLLLFTNDTQWLDHITDPASHVTKTYAVRTRGRLSDAQLQRLRDGVVLADGPARALEVRRASGAGRGRWIELVIDEGRNREVRRMLHAVGGDVRELRRSAIGALELGALAPSAWRVLEAGEVARLEAPS